MKKLLIVLLLLSSCSSIRMKYEAEVQSAAGPAKKFQYERSYEVGGGIPTICGLSAIFLGGACWYYLVMPTVPDENRVQADAEAELKKELLGQSYTVQSTKIERVNWKDEPLATKLE